VATYAAIAFLLAASSAVAVGCKET
jgi:hypothetical protein